MCDPQTPAVQAWRRAAEALAADLDSRAVDRVLTWIAIESCGNECSIDGSKTWQDAAGWIQDAGVMQIYFDTETTVVSGTTSAALRGNCSGTSQTQTHQLTDDERLALLTPQIAWLRSAIAHAQAELDAAGCDWSERDRWRWYKFASHGLPAVAKCMLPLVVTQLGRAPDGWDEFRSTCEAMDLDVVRAAAASPEDNGCTACLNAHGAWQTAFHNAEEMDLPDDDGGATGGLPVTAALALGGLLLLLLFFR